MSTSVRRKDPSGLCSDDCLVENAAQARDQRRTTVRHRLVVALIFIFLFLLGEGGVGLAG